MRPLRAAPAAQVLASAEEVNHRLGHENLGSLSGSRGFLPARPPRPALPDSHAPWDEAAAQLPVLFSDVTVRRALDQLPVLPAGPTALPDGALHRAATVLGLLGHAYVHSRAPQPADLPAGIARPWAEVRRRLGRSPEPVLAYTDLIVNNWRFAEGRGTAQLAVEDLQLLVPTAGNQEERVFYLTQVEILARCTPVVRAVVTAQQAVLDDDAEALRHSLDEVADALRTVTRRSLPLIAPRPSSAGHVDPVIWAKTVAPLAVPFTGGVLGPSGTASPVFNLLDAFLGRRASGSQLGGEILLHRRSYPFHWRRFLDAVDQISVPAYIRSRSRPDLLASFEAAQEAYAGPDGFLGRHRRKVSGYLAVAFMVGRSVTIGGFTGSPRERTWRTVDAALTESRLERSPAPGGGEGRRPGPAAGGPARPDSWTAVLPGIAVGDLVEHNDDEHGWWLAIEGRVHDVTGFVRRHPGGEAVLRAHAGLDASTAFARAHPDRPGLRRLLRTTEIGLLRHPALAEARSVHDAWVDALFTVVHLQNAFRLDRSFGRGTALCRPDGDLPSALQVDRAEDTVARFGEDHLPRLAAEVLEPLARRVLRAQQADARRIRVVSGRTGDRKPPGCSLRRRLDLLDRRLAATKAFLVSGSRCFDAWGDGVLATGNLWRLAAQAVTVCAGAPTVAVQVARRAC
jgi:Indoleamine 2,3-dioxygenase/Cytochrome b5-like Heme/Steroid binding domain